ncbi:MAG: signal recognition particle-docking protein FtsY [Verrucomicrobia bacterium]|nr:signal recognition particle-docking protein FtsY [Verrucomicrobiota bacterium]
MAGFFKSLISRFSRDAIDWDDLEHSLISGDMGIRLTTEIIDELKGMGRALDATDVVDVCRKRIMGILPQEVVPMQPLVGRPLVILVVGVNGTGKTTSTAKLANYLRFQGHSVMLAAADTFRAAAIEQLDLWAQRIGVPIVKGVYKSDPSSVCFDAYARAAKERSNFLLVDTAGRLHTRHNLMQELSKVQRTLAKNDPEAPHEIFLVVDATTGSNAMAQAKEFNAAVGGLTGLIITKLDGSGKGGVAVSIMHELGIPPRFIGYGEEVDQFYHFDPDWFAENIL